MRHQKTRNKLSRDSAHRKSLLMNLTKEVLEHERIKTTEAKAKAVKPEIEKLITLAKRGDLHARRQALSALAQDKFAVHKLFAEVAPRYADVPGGYTRILKLGPRRTDATEMVFSSWSRVAARGAWRTMVTKLTHRVRRRPRSPAGRASPAQRTVQGELERALHTVLGEQRADGEPLTLTVAGRTDRGVHAWGQVASYRHEALDPRA